MESIFFVSIAIEILTHLLFKGEPVLGHKDQLLILAHTKKN